MARKSTVRSATPVRNTPIPKIPATPVVAAKPAATQEMIAKRAYEIWQSNGGGELENWLRAERELTSL